MAWANNASKQALSHSQICKLIIKQGRNSVRKVRLPTLQQSASAPATTTAHISMTLLAPFKKTTTIASSQVPLAPVRPEARPSYLPGRSSALSRMSGLLVPAKTTTPCVVANPSISTKSWFRVFSRSSFPPANPPRPLALPMASISSAPAHPKLQSKTPDLSTDMS